MAMKLVTRKAKSVRTGSRSESKIDTGSVFIGARKSGSEVIVSREITRRSGTKPAVIIKSTRTKLPKDNNGTGKHHGRDWMRNPEIGAILTAAFGRAVKAAKRRSAKLHE